jgi:hypothetical protein
MRDKLASSPHRLDDISETPPLVIPNVPRAIAGQAPTHLAPQSSPAGRPPPPVKSWDVYVDNFIRMVQGNRVHRQHVKRVLIHALDSFFRKLETTDNPHRQEPASIKKMLKGDATCSTRKHILGWVVDTIKMTVELPPHRVERLFELLDSVSPRQRRASANKWGKLLGELRSRRTRSFQCFGRSPKETVQQRHKSAIDSVCSLHPSRLSLARHGHGQTANEDRRIDSSATSRHIGSPRRFWDWHGRCPLCTPSKWEHSTLALALQI